MFVRLNQREAAQFFRCVHLLTRSELPLADGLQAAARDAPSRRLKALMVRVADRLREGEAYESIVPSIHRALPWRYRQIALAAEQTSNAPQVAGDLSRHQEQLKRHWTDLLRALAYPGMLLLLVFTLLCVVANSLIPAWFEVVEEFELSTGQPAMLLIWLDHLKARGLVNIVLVAGLVYLLWRFALPAVWRCRLRMRLPIVGPIFRSVAICESAYTLSVMFDHQLPLPDALKLCGSKLQDAAMRDTFRRMVSALEGGGRFSEVLSRQPSIPAFVLPLIRWGESEQAAAESLRMVADLAQTQARRRSTILQSVVPFLVLVLTVVAFATAIFGILNPMLILGGGFYL